MIRKYLNDNMSRKQKNMLAWEDELVESMIHQLEQGLIAGDPTIGLPYWSVQNPERVTEFTFIMSELGFCTTKVLANYSSITFNTGLLDQSKLLKWRKKQKLEKFVMRLDEKEYENDLVRRNGVISKGDVPRPGMMKTSKNRFMIDIKYLEKYERAIRKNLKKSIEKGIEKKNISDKFFSDKASYMELVDDVLAYYKSNPFREYNSECNISEQRYRSIKKILKRIGNYIASKDFRAMLVIPKQFQRTIRPDDTEILEEIYLFIAELLGHKCIGGTRADKIKAGMIAYQDKELPRLDLKTDHGRKELYELIWLERIYDKLDTMNKWGFTLWNVPIEIDFSMSLAQIIGALTNDERLLRSTSLLGETLNDPWYIKGVKRVFAKIGTAIFYGSSASLLALAKHNGVLEGEDNKPNKNDKEQIKILSKEFNSGRFGILKQFKDLFIQNYNNKKEVINIYLGEGYSRFNIHVNKFVKVGSEIVLTVAYDSKKKKYKNSFTRNPIMVPDFERMKLFWPTCLVHHLDSDLQEYICYTHNNKWILDVHDADICCPWDSRALRATGAERLKKYNDDRHIIIPNFMKSIGATTDKALLQYDKLLKSVVNADDSLPYSENCMK